MNLAPIILFVYNRPEHTERTLEALKANVLAHESVLYIYSDGPDEGVSVQELEQIKDVRSIINATTGFKDVIVVEQEKNLGLATSVIKGITEVINRHGRIIVLEDDLITSPYFLTYCNEGLELYSDERNVYSINAFQFPLGIDTTSTFLSPQGTSSWGWATWKSKWDTFDKNTVEKELVLNHEFVRKRFNLADYNKSNALKNKNSWAIIWYYSVFVRNGLGLFPTKSLVENIGFDGTGVHCSEVKYSQDIIKEPIVLEKQETINLAYYSKVLDWFTSEEAPAKEITESNKSKFRNVRRLLKKIKKLGKSK